MHETTSRRSVRKVYLSCIYLVFCENVFDCPLGEMGHGLANHILYTRIAMNEEPGVKSYAIALVACFIYVNTG